MTITCWEPSDPTTTEHDAVLFARANDGDVQAAGTLVFRYHFAALRAASMIVRNRVDAEDAVSTASIRVIAAITSGRVCDGASVRSYLCTAARRAAIDIAWRGPRTVEDAHDRPCNDDGPEQAAINRDDCRRMAAAFASLPERWQTVLELTVLRGESLAVVGTTLDLSPNAVAQLALRARRALREAYDAQP